MKDYFKGLHLRMVQLTITLFLLCISPFVFAGSGIVWIICGQDILKFYWKEFEKVWNEKGN